MPPNVATIAHAVAGWASGPSTQPYRRCSSCRVSNENYLGLHCRFDVVVRPASIDTSLNHVIPFAFSERAQLYHLMSSIFPRFRACPPSGLSHQVLVTPRDWVAIVTVAALGRHRGCGLSGTQQASGRIGVIVRLRHVRNIRVLHEVSVWIHSHGEFRLSIRERRSRNLRAHHHFVCVTIHNKMRLLGQVDRAWVVRILDLHR